jgi:hypothetical protein
VTSFEPGSELEASMYAALADPAAMPGFHAQLAESKLLVPLAEGSSPRGPFVFPRVRFEERVGVPVFTSAEELVRVMPPESVYVEMTGREVALGLDDKTELLVNPGGTLGLALPAETLRRIA